MKEIKVKENAKRVQKPVKRDGTVYVVEIGYSHDRTLMEALMKQAKSSGFDPRLRVEKHE